MNRSMRLSGAARSFSSQPSSSGGVHLVSATSPARLGLTVRPSMYWIAPHPSNITTSSTSNARANKKCLSFCSAYLVHYIHQTNSRRRNRFYTASRNPSLCLSFGKKIRYYRLL
ncbi:hypothetical protein V2G26_007377 [Clonostachys chloroleuca]